jgi:hypothetical protein
VIAYFQCAHGIQDVSLWISPYKSENQFAPGKGNLKIVQVSNYQSLAFILILVFSNMPASPIAMIITYTIIHVRLIKSAYGPKEEISRNNLLKFISIIILITHHESTNMTYTADNNVIAIAKNFYDLSRETAVTCTRVEVNQLECKQVHDVRSGKHKILRELKLTFQPSDSATKNE